MNSVLIFFIISTSLISVSITRYLTSFPRMGNLRASASSTLLFILFFKITGQTFIEYESTLTAAFFGASFVGMSSEIKMDMKGLLIAALIFSLLYIFILPRLEGLGGSLGLTAFLSVLVTGMKERISPYRSKQKR